MNILITGGCGFIGVNAALKFHRLGHKVSVLDDLSRAGSKENRDLLKYSAFHYTDCVVQTGHWVTRVINKGFDVILHLAAQTAVTTSLIDPCRDFEVNALGTLNILEAVRKHSPKTIVLYASTNKVYGSLAARQSTDINETFPLDFHTPYACSKGCADQYILDYARSFDLRTVSLRQSCIYGPHQLASSDQGWVSWFIKAHLSSQPVTIFGNGRQVRDVLHVDDLIDCYLKCIENIDVVRGLPINIGGGPSNAISLLEFMRMLEHLSGKPVNYKYGDARPGDQLVYVSDNSRAKTMLNWEPKISAGEGIKSLYGYYLGSK